MAIRIAHGLTGALSGAAGFLTKADERADRRGAVAAGAANQSFALAQRKREFAFNANLAIADRQPKGLPGGSPPKGNPNEAADGARQKKLDKKAADQADTDRANQELKDAGYRPPGIPGGSAQQSQPQSQSQGQPQQARSRSGGMPGGMVRNLMNSAQQDQPQQDQPQQVQPQGNPQQGQQARAQGQQAEAQKGGYSDDNSMASQLRARMSGQALTPEGQRIAGDLTGKLRAIESQKDQMRPEQYSGLMNRWMQDYNESGIDAFEKQKPNINGEMQGRYKNFGTGVGAVMQPDGTIKPFEVDPAKVAASKAAQNSDKSQTKTAAELMGDDKSYAKLEQEAIAGLTSDRQKAITDGGGDPDGFDASSIDNAEIAKRVRTMAEKQEADARRSAEIRKQAIYGDAQMPGQTGQAGQAVDSSGLFADPVRQLSYGEMMGGVPADPSMAAGQPLRLPYSLQQPGLQSSSQTPTQPEPMATEADVAAAEADGWQIPMKPPEGGMAGYAERAEKQKLNRSPQETAARESIGMSIESRRNTGDAEISQQYDSLAKSLQSKGREMTPEQFVDPWAVSAASKSGQKDPIGYAMKTANEALESGKPHISTISSMERNTHDQNGVQRFVGSPEQVQAQADKLPINTFYYDSDGYLRQRLPEKAKKKEPVVITDADRRASERILGRDFGRP